MTTPTQQHVIDAILAAVRDDARIESLWLSGSLATGHGDEWSDVDLVAVVGSGDPPEAVADAYASNLDIIVESVHVIRPFPRLISAIRLDWTRFDLQFMAPEGLSKQNAQRLSPLFAQPGAARPANSAPGSSSGSFDVEVTAREFLRIVGLAPGVMARGHLLMAVDGMNLLRGLCIDLMLAENGYSRSAASPKRLESLLTDEQREALRSLPPVIAAQDSLLALQVALARLFLPRGRAYAAAHGATWPETFEDSTRSWLRRSLGVELG